MTYVVVKPRGPFKLSILIHKCKDYIQYKFLVLIFFCGIKKVITYTVYLRVAAWEYFLWIIQLLHEIYNTCCNA